MCQKWCQNLRKFLSEVTFAPRKMSFVYPVNLKIDSIFSNFRNRKRGGRASFPSDRNPSLQDILRSENVTTTGDDKNIIGTRIFGFGGGGDKYGSSCTDTCGNPGTCSYIADSQCTPVLEVSIQIYLDLLMQYCNSK